MYEYVEKTKKSTMFTDMRERAVANSTIQKKDDVNQDFGFVDNRAKSELHHKMKIVPDKYHENILQLAKILPLQNKRTEGEMLQIKNGAQHYNAQIIWDWLPGKMINIDDNDDLFIVTHGNTSSIGDANEGEKYNIDYSPHQAATLLDRILPQTYGGKIWLWSCHGSESDNGQLSVADSIMTNLSRLRKGNSKMKNIEMRAFEGSVDGNMDLKTTTTIINKREVLAHNKITRYKYVRGKRRNRLGKKELWKLENSNLLKRLKFSERLFYEQYAKASTKKQKRKLKKLFRAQWVNSRSKKLNKML